MEKLQQIIPEKISMLGHKVIVPEQVYDNIIYTLNKQTSVINEIIDVLDETRKQVNELEGDTSALQTAIQNLAKALRTLTEE